MRAANTSNGLVVAVPSDAGDFYVTEEGVLFCRQPWSMSVSYGSLSEFGITPSSEFRRATREELRESGLTAYPVPISALIFPN